MWEIVANKWTIWNLYNRSYKGCYVITNRQRTKQVNSISFCNANGCYTLVHVRWILLLISQVISNVEYEETQWEKYPCNSVKDIDFIVGSECKTEAGNALNNGGPWRVGRVRTVLNGGTRYALKWEIIAHSSISRVCFLSEKYMYTWTEAMTTPKQKHEKNEKLHNKKS